MDEWADLKELLGFRDGYSIIKCRRVEWAEVLAAIKHATPLPPTERELSSALSAQAAEVERLRGGIKLGMIYADIVRGGASKEETQSEAERDYVRLSALLPPAAQEMKP